MYFSGKNRAILKAATTMREQMQNNILKNFPLNSKTDAPPTIGSNTAATDKYLHGN